MEILVHFLVCIVFLAGRLLSDQAKCPAEKHLFTNCTNPCTSNDTGNIVCLTSPEAECRPDYCGGCVARFFDKSGQEVHCELEEGIICEMKTNTISCAHTQGTALHINRANYGRTSMDTCQHPYGIERLHNDTNCESNNSSAIVRDLCEGRVSCQLIADGTTFGDPCPGIYKYLDVDFECRESVICPPEKHFFTNCSNPCMFSGSEPASCITSPDAECRPDYCGGCVARFYDRLQKEIHCEEEEGFICEMKTNTISCSQTLGTTLHIVHANYGRTSVERCQHPYGMESLHNNTSCIANSSLSVVQGLCEDKISCTLTADNSLFGEPCYGVYKYLEVDFECKESYTCYFSKYDNPVCFSNHRSPSSVHILLPCLVVAIGTVTGLVVITIWWRKRIKRKRLDEFINTVAMSNYFDESGDTRDERILIET